MEALLDRGRKVELFEQIRREYEHKVGTIRAAAKKPRIHWRMVRRVLADAQPPARRKAERNEQQLGPVKRFIDTGLEADQRAPRKQRHTVHRVYQQDPAEKAASNGFRIDGETVRGLEEACRYFQRSWYRADLCV